MFITADEEDNDVPEVPKKAKSRLGDIYELGNHRVLCGDATQREAVSALCGAAKVDLFLTDPPYNVDYEGKTKEALKIKNDKMVDGKFRQFLVDAFKAADSAMKKGAVFYIWHADSEGYNFRGGATMLDG
jgi:site-specific DNA-methyltransferase (adenine-specific)